MKFIIIATDSHGGIGKNGTIPWHSSADFAHFKESTINSTIVMGKNTWLSLPVKPLPNRRNIVVSSDDVDGVETVKPAHIREFISSYPQHGKLFVIGGKMLIDHVYDLMDGALITEIHGNWHCDVVMDLKKILANQSLTSTKYLQDGSVVKKFEK